MWRTPDTAGAVAEIDIRGILAALEAGGVEFLVIGGLAVGFHGYVRATKDVDVVPSPDRENLRRLALVLRDLDATVDGAGEFDRDELPDPLDPEQLESEGNWVLDTRMGRLDVMQFIGDHDLWGKLAPNAIETEVDELTIRVVSYDDLVELKELAGRPEDLLDLERMRRIRET